MSPDNGVRDASLVRPRGAEQQDRGADATAGRSATSDRDATENHRPAQAAHQQVHRGGQEAAQGEELDREEGGATEVHAEQAQARAVRDAARRRHLSGELD